MNSKYKYLKYKNKYLTLKKQYGGMVNGEDIILNEKESKKNKFYELLENATREKKIITNRIKKEIHNLIDNNFNLDAMQDVYNFTISDNDGNVFNIFIDVKYPFNKQISINKMIIDMEDVRDTILNSIDSYKKIKEEKKILILCHNRKINIDNIEKDHQCFIVYEGSDTLHSSLMEHIPPNSKLITMDRVGTPNILADLWDESFIENFKGFFDGLFMLDCHTWNDANRDSIEIPIKTITHTRRLIKDSGFAIYSTAPHVIDKVCEKIKEMNLKCEIIDEKAKTTCYPKYLKITSL